METRQKWMAPNHDLSCLHQHQCNIWSSVDAKHDAERKYVLVVRQGLTAQSFANEESCDNAEHLTLEEDEEENYEDADEQWLILCE